jgi:hypothetical protein
MFPPEKGEGRKEGRKEGRSAYITYHNISKHIFCIIIKIDNKTTMTIVNFRAIFLR